MAAKKGLMAKAKDAIVGVFSADKPARRKPAKKATLEASAKKAPARKTSAKTVAKKASARPVLASYHNVKTKLVCEWQRGEKRPSRPS